ncbi:MAG: hypothetical protein ACI4WW_01860 [Candidatus Coprovivens sp.]
MNKIHVRLIPMSHELEFPNRTIEDIQNNFFLGNEMPLSAGGNSRQYFSKKGLLNVEEDDFLLFQMNGTIIASAELFSGITNISDDDVYKAVYLLKKNSIKVFKPITKEELIQHCPKFNDFGQGKTDLSDYDLDIDWLLNRIND